MTTIIPSDDFLSQHPDLVFPTYQDHSIANIPATVAALLNAPAMPGLPALSPNIWQAYAPAQRVIVLIIDAAGYETFVRSFNHPAIEHTHALTSVFPSTTVAALASLWSGRAPAQHGLLGTRLWLREYGMLAQMIHLKSACRGYPDQLVGMGLKPEAFLPRPNLTEHLAQAGISTHDFIPRAFINSGLTRMLHRGVQHIHPVTNIGDALCKLRSVLESAPGQALYAHLYYGDIDESAHHDGPSTPTLALDLDTISYLIHKELIARLSPQAAQGTVLLVSADHGQIHTPPQRGIDLHRHPGLWQNLVTPPGGEPRAGYLIVRDGHKQAIQDYVQRNLAHTMDVIDTEVALQAGLWGPGTPHPHTQERLGDLLLLPRDNYWLVDPFDETPRFLGWHGGLSPQEMRVPLLISRLTDN